MKNHTRNPIEGEQATTCAALYVDERGPYAHLRGVEIWTADAAQQSLIGGPVGRDARAYAGPWPVVAHPPCERWGRYWPGGPSARVRRALGDDGGCFAAALEAVRRWGGVLEHPEASHAWAAFGLARPPRAGGWVAADDRGGSTCCVEQGHYGHPARKATWLYACGVDLPELAWGPCGPRARLDRGYHTAEERSAARAAGAPTERRLSARQCWETPRAFRDLLLSIARTAEPLRACG